MTQVIAPEGLRTFFIVWFGQMISVIGSGLTQFGLAIWVFIETDSVTSLALVILAGAVPAIVVGPFAGTIVDRIDRRLVMLAADTMAGAATLTLALLWIAGNLEFWHILLVAGVGSVANAFQEPAYLASVTLLVPKRHLNRANGLTNANQALGFVLTPILAGVLLGTIGIGGILLIDFGTFLFAVGTLLFVRFPRPKRIDEDEEGDQSLWEGTVAGLRYLTLRRGLLLFLFLAAALNFLLGFINVLAFPLILSFTNEAMMGTIMSAIGVAMLAGSVVASAWGGPQGRMRFILSAMMLGGVFLAITGMRASALWVAVWMMGFMVLVPIINATSQALWQTKVEPIYQGRVFATRRVIATIATPVAYLLAGPLADNVFEPLLAGGGLADSVGRIIGTGPGRGIGLMFVIMGLGVTVVALIGFTIKPLRNVESDLPDVIDDPLDDRELDPESPETISDSTPG